jgi:hypothetical protein
MQWTSTSCSAGHSRQVHTIRSLALGVAGAAWQSKQDVSVMNTYVIPGLAGIKNHIFYETNRKLRSTVAYPAH